jgi:glycosyltransferase involved in cell wall biosynthesis
MNFSVLLCVYVNDDPEHFRDALRSIIDQTVVASEIVLIIDGPVGNETQAIIAEESSRFHRFKIIQLKNNVGHGRARQIGIENCSYDFIALMDSDDICVSDRFEEQVRSFESNDRLSVVGGWIDEFHSDISSPIGVRKLPADDIDIKKYMRYRCPMNQVTVMFKKADVLEAGGYLHWHHEEDYYLWLRMFLAKNEFKNLQKILVHVRANEQYFARRGGLEYFLSEARLQKYMYDNSIINVCQLAFNITVRFIIQLSVPNSVRRYIFLFMRKSL